MQRDLIIGLLASLLIHGGFLFGGNLFKHGAPKLEKQKEENLIQMELKTPPPDETEEVQDLKDETPNQIAPPSLVDLPSVVTVTSFVQQVQPPPPPGLATDKAALNIPVIKPGTNFGAGMKDLFNMSDLDQKPEPRVQPSPVYPFEMKRAGIQGEVTVEFIIDYNGNVLQIQVVKSTQREFEAPVIQAVSKWKFKPGKKGGRVVNVRASQTIPFNLSDN
jgi:periplasmic protein TonB